MMDTAFLNFSFVIPGTLAGMANPGYGSDLAANLEFLNSKGIGAIVSLTSSVPDVESVNAQMQSLHLPVPDFHAPTQKQIDRFVGYVDQTLASGRAVAVHCGAGMGRTGTMLACYMVRTGKEAREAIETVRNLRPGSIETMGQERAIYEYWERIRNSE